MSPTTFESGTTPPTAAANEVVAAVATTCSGYPTLVTWQQDDPEFTLRFLEQDTVTHEPGYAADKIISAVGTQMDAWTVTFGSSPYLALGAIATFN